MAQTANEIPVQHRSAMAEDLSQSAFTLCFPLADTFQESHQPDGKWRNNLRFCAASAAGDSQFAVRQEFGLKKWSQSLPTEETFANTEHIS